MYDNGNCISVPATSLASTHCSSISNSKKVTYKENCATGTVNGESYSMSMANNGISVLWFQRYTKDAISINGNLGADGQGALSTGSYTFNGWKGFWKIVWNAGNDPGINHLWVTNAPSALHDYDNTRHWDWDQLSNINGYEVIYLKWATVPRTRTSDLAMNQLIEAIVGNNSFRNYKVLNRMVIINYYLYYIVTLIKSMCV